jgi:hypothetical protein
MDFLLSWYLLNVLRLHIHCSGHRPWQFRAASLICGAPFRLPHPEREVRGLHRFLHDSDTAPHALLASTNDIEHVAFNVGFHSREWPTTLQPLAPLECFTHRRE